MYRSVCSYALMCVCICLCVLKTIFDSQFSPSIILIQDTEDRSLDLVTNTISCGSSYKPCKFSRPLTFTVPRINWH